ncbi:MAG: hypothetical protein AABP62_10795 [Planctomycetota bacterium]
MTANGTDREARCLTPLPFHRQALPTANSLFSTPPADWIENRERIDNFCRSTRRIQQRVAKFNGFAMVRLDLVFESWDVAIDRVRTPFLIPRMIDARIASITAKIFSRGSA